MTVDKLKKKAKYIKKSRNISHTEALNTVAQDHSLKHWHALMVQAKKSKTADAAFQNGIITGFNLDQYGFSILEHIEPWDFPHIMTDSHLSFIVRDKLYDILTIPVIDESIKSVLSPQKLLVYEEIKREGLKDEFHERFQYYSLHSIPNPQAFNTLEDVIKYCNDHTVYVPDFFFFKGEYIDNYHGCLFDEHVY